jgi:hypothetical protein
LSSTQVQNCVQNSQSNSANKTFQNNISDFNVILRGCVGGFVHNNAEGIIAIFTVILALSTVFLWRATRDLVNEARETSRRQLRAYVFTDGGAIDLTNGPFRYSPELPDIPDGVFVRVHTVFKNFGQTPAYEFTVWRLIDILDAENPRFGKIGMGITKDVIGPGGVSEITAQRPITSAELAAVKDGTKFIYSWGRIEYVDAFKKRQHFEFYSRNGRPRMEGWALETAEHSKTS